jgi:hypothetical protein
MNEIRFSDVKENKPQNVENFKNIKPEKEMTTKELNNAVKDELEKAAKEAKEAKNYEADGVENVTAEKNIDPSHKECLTTSEERKEFASYSKGDWDGEPGDSKFHPEQQETRDALARYKQDGINYIDGEPDFSKVSEISVEIDDMTSSCPHNFRQADEICADQWNTTLKDGRNDWTGRDVEAWRKENRYSWHECLDRKTMNLVQRDIHEECKHYGGRAECRRQEALNGGGFDE